MGRRLAGQTDGRTGILQQKPVVAAWWEERGVGGLVRLLFVCLLVCQVVMISPCLCLGEGGLGQDYLLGDQRVKLCFDVEEQGD